MPTSHNEEVKSSHSKAFIPYRPKDRADNKPEDGSSQLTAAFLRKKYFYHKYKTITPGKTLHDQSQQFDLGLNKYYYLFPPSNIDHIKYKEELNIN